MSQSNLKPYKASDKANILFQMTGSIACFKACQVLSKLVQAGYSVQVVASAAALQFVGNATIEGLTGKQVVSDLYEPGRMMDHIHLVRWADLIIAAPASANFINKIASGVGDDLLTTQFLAHDFKKPFLLAPAMNTAMYLHPITQASIQKLRALKVEILETASGVLACGEVGWGRLLEPDLIFQEIEKRLQSISESSSNLTTFEKKASGPRVLVTSGGTSEAIDSVRVLTNKSTGSTGAHITDTLLQLGFAVTYVHASTAVLPNWDCEKQSFQSFSDLKTVLESELSKKDYVAVIHAAAVSDFSPTASSPGKISSDGDFELKLKQNPKLVDHLREMAQNPDLQVIAFKMTAHASEKGQLAAVEKLFSHSKANLIVQNDLDEMDPSTGKHFFHVYRGTYKEKDLHSKNELSFYLGQYLNDFLSLKSKAPQQGIGK
jgi:phosphopantothenoylcysteine decarboxylase/phosphopantothenate--cysteine ligase